MVHRFWEGTVNGGYVTHGETYRHPDDIIWWAKGGVLHGESAARLQFLLETLEQGPAAGLDPQDNVLRMFACAGQPHDYYLTYFGVHQPAQLSFNVPEGERYAGTVVDIWNMSATPVEQPVVSGTTLELPGKPYHAVILRRIR